MQGRAWSGATRWLTDEEVEQFVAAVNAARDRRSAAHIALAEERKRIELARLKNLQQLEQEEAELESQLFRCRVSRQKVEIALVAPRAHGGIVVMEDAR